MPTYVVGDIHITDHTAYQRMCRALWRQLPVLVGASSPAVARSICWKAIQMPERVFIIEFPSAAAARRWYQSVDHQEALKVRLSASLGRVFLIEGNAIS